MMSLHHISIPYGAIKSYRPNIKKVVRSVISIPYGAIKRIHEPSGILPNF